MLESSFYIIVLLLCFPAFAELQLSVDALASDLEGTGMPFLTEKEYATRVLFKGLHTLPDSADQEVSRVFIV